MSLLEGYETPWEDVFIQVTSLGPRANDALQRVRSIMEERNSHREYWQYAQTIWLWSFCQAPAGVELNSRDMKDGFKSAALCFLFVDTADEISIRNAERIGHDEELCIITFLFGNGGQDAKERIAATVDCFLDLRDSRLERYEIKESPEQLAYDLIRGLIAPVDEEFLVGLDFADVRDMFFHGGEIHFGLARTMFEADADDSQRVVTKEALQRLEAQCNLRSARRLYLSCVSETLGSVYGLNEAANILVELMDEDCTFIFNSSKSDAEKDYMMGVLFATETPVIEKPSYID